MSEEQIPPASLLPTATDIFNAIKKDDVDHLQHIINAFSSIEEALEMFNGARTLDADSLPPVSYALLHKCRKSFLFLLSNNEHKIFVSPLLLDEAKWNALTFAVESNNAEAVKILLDFASDVSTEFRDTLVNQRTSEDWFPLTYAIVNGNVEIVKMLLQVPEIDAKSTVDEMSHKEIAETRKYFDIAKTLEEKEK